MKCYLCCKDKLRREFPFEPLTENCNHAPLHCLRVSIIESMVILWSALIINFKLINLDQFMQFYGPGDEAAH